MDTKCILTPYAKTNCGYGLTRFEGKTRLQHRVEYCKANNVTIKSIEGKIVMHKCDNPACINPEHLELGTYQSNMADKIAKGRLDKTKYQGTANGRAKLTEDDIRAIRSRFHKETADGLAAEFGVTFSAIYRIATRVTWKHVV